MLFIHISDFQSTAPKCNNIFAKSFLNECLLAIGFVHLFSLRSVYFSFATPWPLGLSFTWLLLAPFLAFEHDTLPDPWLCARSPSHLGGAETKFLLYALLKDVLHTLRDVNIIPGRCLVVM